MNTPRPISHSAMRVLLLTAGLLSIPLIAMQFGREVQWDVFDFTIMGVLIAGTGMAYEVVVRRSGTLMYRLATALGLGSLFFLMWVNLAVGVIGSEDNPANVMYLAVFSVAFLGAIFARLRPRGMAWTMFAAAAVQVAVAVVAVVLGMAPENGMIQVVGITGMFVTLFVGAGGLYLTAEAEELERSAA